MRLKNIGEILQLNCVACDKLNTHLIIYKKHIDTVTKCKSCEEITLILDEEFIENYLKSYS